MTDHTMQSGDASNIPGLMDAMDAGPAPEPADAVRAWLDAHGDGFGAFIDGAFIDGASGDGSGAAPGDAATPIWDPATGDRLAAVARSSAGVVGAAVAAAARAGAGWAAALGHARARHLRAIARALEERGRFLSVLGALNSGRPVRAARVRDVPRAVQCFAHHAGSAALCATDFPGRAPLGVVALILPRHATLWSLARDAAPALAAGNAVVIKPAAGTPLVALAFAELCRDAGLPPGVVGVAPGDAATGAALVRHPGVGRVAFAGSGAVARAIGAAAAASGASLDLRPDAGPDRALVFADADLDAAVEGVVDAAWSGGGATGRAGVRVLVQEGAAERFAAKLRRRLAILRVGDPRDGTTDIGAVADAARLRRLVDLVAAAEVEGAEPVRAGAAPPAAGLFFPPTLLLGVEPASSLARTAFSGPIAALSTFRTPAEAVALAGDGRCGASVWSQDVDLALDMAMRVRADAVWINSAEAEPGDAAVEADGRGADGRGAVEAHLGPPPRPAAPRGLTPPAPEPRARRGGVDPAVAAAVAAGRWSLAPARDRARALEASAEALSRGARGLVDRLSNVMDAAAAGREVEAALRRASFYAAWAGRLDRLDGRAGTARARRLALSIDEPHGVLGLVCPDEAPLLALLSLALPALAAGNRVVAVPSTLCPSAAADLAAALDAGGLPPGALSLAPGERGPQARALAGHRGVAAVWDHGPPVEAPTGGGTDIGGGTDVGVTDVAGIAARGCKPVWAEDGSTRDWLDDATAQGPDFLRRAVRVKAVWLPHGE